MHHAPESATVTPDGAETDRRLTDLEIKASYGEDLLDRLNDIVARQQQQIERLERELATLGRLLDGAVVSTPRSLRDELPPHY